MAQRREQRGAGTKYAEHHVSDSAGAPPLEQMDSGAPGLFTMSNSDAPGGARFRKRQDAFGELKKVRCRPGLLFMVRYFRALDLRRT
jgi:hypothetical protein